MSNLDVYAISDDEESDPDPIYHGDVAGLIGVLGDVTLEPLDDGIFNVLNADGVVIAVAYDA